MRGFLMFIGFLVLGGFVAPPALADESCEKARNSADVMKCLTRKHDASQEALNSVFDVLSLENSGAELDELKNIQAHWVEYRDRECAIETANLETESLKRLETLRCLQRLTQYRIEALQNSMKFDVAPAVFGETAAALPRWMNALASDYPDVYWAYGAQTKGDLDCDGDDEYVMRGLRPLADMIMAEPVVAISENPLTGRPRAVVVTPVFSQAQEEETAAPGCGLVTGLEIAKPAALDISQEAHDVETGRQTVACGAQLIVRAAHCKRSAVYVWDGKDYVRQAGQ